MATSDSTSTIAPGAGDAARQVVAQARGVEPARGLGGVGDDREHGRGDRRPREVAAQAGGARAHGLGVGGRRRRLGAGGQDRDAAAARRRGTPAPGGSGSRRSGTGQPRGRLTSSGSSSSATSTSTVVYSAMRAAIRAPPSLQRAGLDRGRRAGRGAHAERERALERVAVLGGDGVPVDPVGAGRRASLAGVITSRLRPSTRTEARTAGPPPDGFSVAPARLPLSGSVNSSDDARRGASRRAGPAPGSSRRRPRARTRAPRRRARRRGRRAGRGDGASGGRRV